MKKLIIASLLSAASMGAMAETCSVTITGNDAMQYDTKEFAINKGECAEFTVHLKHGGQLPAAAMGHNVVITKTADVEAVSNDAIAAGAPNYLKEGDERIIAHTKMIGGGEEDSVTFSTEGLVAGEDYEFFCSFPGHHAIMKGKITVTE